MRKLLFRSSVGGVVRRDESRRNRPTVRALDELSFELADGDRVGLIGQNGAGKSTLLRVMSGAYRPSSGSIEVEGTVSALLTLGIGFDPEETGYENIHNGCLLVGMSPTEIREKMDEIADFTRLGDYLSMPARTYSSGMQLRLSFSIATALDPEILLLDEIMAAGDAAFITKARQRIDNLMEQASLLVLTSHSSETIRQFCNKAIFLRSGHVEEFGPVESTLNAYEQWLAAA